MRLPSIVSIPIRRTADVASASSVALARTASILRAIAGEDARKVPVDHQGGGASQTRDDSPPPRGRTRPSRDGAEEHTDARRAAERREPTPEPAAGASAAQAAGQRRPST